MALILGINSGSSFDGIDVIISEIGMADDGHPTRPVTRASRSFQWPDAVAEQVLKSFENGITIFELCRLNYTAGAVFAECARAVMREAGIAKGELDVIGYDGQTIYQEPPVHHRLADYADDENLVARWQEGVYACGLQIGEPAILAAACEAVTVTHFRPMDHALGGTGAPMTQYLDFIAFRDVGPVMTLNIGGIANCQVADADRTKMVAFDTGPGNVMMDHAMRRLYGRPYDKDGEAAASGTVNAAMLARLLDHDYFKKPVPRSAWRLDFGSAYADGILAEFGHLSPADIMATLTEFTAAAIDRSVRDNVRDLFAMRQVIANGGGLRNLHLMRRLKAYLPGNLPIVPIDDYGIPGQFKEALDFAVLAYGTVNGLANNVTASTGSRGWALLGKVTYPPRMAKP